MKTLSSVDSEYFELVEARHTEKRCMEEFTKATGADRSKKKRAAIKAENDRIKKERNLIKSLARRDNLLEWF